MKNLLPTLLLLFSSLLGLAQNQIAGQVTDKSGNPISGANVYLEGTYDGASTDVDGNFHFETTEKGDQTLVVSILGYETHYEMGNVSYFSNLKIKLTEAINTLTGVTLG